MYTANRKMNGALLAVILSAGSIARGGDTYTQISQTASPYGDFVAVRANNIKADWAGFKGFTGELDSATGSPWGQNISRQPPAGSDGTMFYNSTRNGYFFVNSAVNRTNDPSTWYSAFSGLNEKPLAEAGAAANTLTSSARWIGDGGGYPDLVVIGGLGLVRNEVLVRTTGEQEAPALMLATFEGEFCAASAAPPPPAEQFKPRFVFYYYRYYCGGANSYQDSCSGNIPGSSMSSPVILSNIEEELTVGDGYTNCQIVSSEGLFMGSRMRGYMTGLKVLRTNYRSAGTGGNIPQTFRLISIKITRIMSF